ncbi:MAG: urease subunit beta [Odoribacter sp.]|nr:urease subunit beta [Bacteroidales bacterium]MBR2980531.1 urease subunit beta [Odoribacter sp.]
MSDKIDVPIGGVLLAKDDLEYNVGRKVITIKVKNCGNRPIQIGSHFHFFEVNRYLQFNRAAAYGYHLNIPATTAIRFEPGQEKSVELVPFGGKQYITGFNGLVEGYTGTEDAPFFLPKRVKAIEKMKKYGFKNEEYEQDIKTTE